MSVLQKYTTQEAVNVDSSAIWDVQTVVTTTDTTTTHINVSDYHILVIDTTATIDILFDNKATTNCNDSNDLKIPLGVTSMKIPKGLGNIIYLHWRRDGSNNATVRMVLC